MNIFRYQMKTLENYCNSMYSTPSYSFHIYRYCVQEKKSSPIHTHEESKSI